MLFELASRDFPILLSFSETRLGQVVLPRRKGGTSVIIHYASPKMSGQFENDKMNQYQHYTDRRGVERCDGKRKGSDVVLEGMLVTMVVQFRKKL